MAVRCDGNVIMRCYIRYIEEQWKHKSERRKHDREEQGIWSGNQGTGVSHKDFRSRVSPASSGVGRTPELRNPRVIPARWLKSKEELLLRVDKTGCRSVWREKNGGSIRRQKRDDKNRQEKEHRYHDVKNEPQGSPHPALSASMKGVLLQGISQLTACASAMKGASPLDYFRGERRSSGVRL